MKVQEFLVQEYEFWIFPDSDFEYFISKEKFSSSLGLFSIS